MIFKNIKDIKIFNDFLQIYGDSISNIVGNKTNPQIVHIIDSSFPLASLIMKPQDYLACLNDGIGYNEYNCDNIGLSVEERFALIAHEIGHIYDKQTPRHTPKRELVADQMASLLGLKEELINALTKILESGKCDNMEEEIEHRISILSNNRE